MSENLLVKFNAITTNIHLGVFLSNIHKKYIPNSYLFEMNFPFNCFQRDI